MRISVNSGAAIAAAAASLLLADAVAQPSFAADEIKGHCVGANACRGQGACKTATSACAGENACKGKGYLEMTKAECEKIEGATFEPVDQ